MAARQALHFLLIPMRYSLLALWLATAAATPAQVAQIRLVPDELKVNVDGKPFTVFHFGKDANKPFLEPMLAKLETKSDINN